LGEAGKQKDWANQPTSNWEFNLKDWASTQCTALGQFVPLRSHPQRCRFDSYRGPLDYIDTKERRDRRDVHRFPFVKKLGNVPSVTASDQYERTRISG